LVASYDVQPENGEGPILTASGPTKDNKCSFLLKFSNYNSLVRA